ncbi:hypothetical protein [Pseudacidovorax sp. NFM-22]|uniref:hypothetical protein n=1 Tax=Pseudacidovorax sp. NFM-22 TaxID=2744469 RepID=UPI001F297772|nr:hypothetical protein [Pseudacidovorax sp. NFM-22]
MTPADKQKAWEDYQARQRAAQAVYDSFRYTDAQRERLIDFIGAAMKVIRGDAPFEGLARLLPISDRRPAIVSGEAYRGGLTFDFDACFLNQWTGIYMLGTTDDQGKVEPYHFQIELSPPMDLDRERLEQLLKLKVAPGWLQDGGNLYPPEVIMHLGIVRQPATFEYDILKPAYAPYLVKAKLSYINPRDKDPYTATRMVRLEIRRRYLTPEQLRERDQKKFGDMPRTGQRVPKDGRWLGFFADDALNAAIPMQRRIHTLGDDGWFPVLNGQDPDTGRVVTQPAWWQWVGPDPMAEDIERMFGPKKKS